MVAIFDEIYSVNIFPSYYFNSHINIKPPKDPISQQARPLRFPTTIPSESYVKLHTFGRRFNFAKF